VQASSDLRISVVVATRDRPRSLDRTLGKLEALPERPRIVVVDNGSCGDGSRHAVSCHPGAELIELDANHGAAARNVGVRRAGTPYVAFADDDSWWAPGALRTAADTMDRYPTLALLAARVLVGPEERLDPVSSQMSQSPLGTPVGGPGPRVVGFVACGAVVRRSAFLACWGFDPRLGIGAEEQLLAFDLAAAGWGCCYADQVVAHHYPSPRRDPRHRRRIVARNELWCLWLRHPRRAAGRGTLRAVARAARDRDVLAGLSRSVAGLPWVLAERRVASQNIDPALRLGYGNLDGPYRDKSKHPC
jgi:GT2 family glycosyltransferase